MSPKVIARRAPKRPAHPEAAPPPASTNSKKAIPPEVQLRRDQATSAVTALSPAEFTKLLPATAYLTEHRAEGYNTIIAAMPDVVKPVLPFLRQNCALGYRNVIHALQARAQNGQ
jgi:hypothetical protein